jgi:transcriptional regulator with XRE-family HTH domain
MDLSINERIRTRRLEMGLTQLEISKKIGLESPQYISNIERGLCAPSVEVLQKLVHILKIDAHEIVDMMVNSYRQKLESKFLKRRSRS